MADVRGDRLSFEAGRVAAGCARPSRAFGGRAASVRGWIRDQLEQAAGPLEVLDGVPE